MFPGEVIECIPDCFSGESTQRIAEGNLREEIPEDSYNNRVHVSEAFLESLNFAPELKWKKVTLKTIMIKKANLETFIKIKTFFQIVT